jgi:hypothetical protein
MKTDVAGDDQAEYVAAARSLTVRFGTGANAAAGGALGIGAGSTVTFPRHRRHMTTIGSVRLDLLGEHPYLRSSSQITQRFGTMSISQTGASRGQSALVTQLATITIAPEPNRPPPVENHDDVIELPAASAICPTAVTVAWFERRLRRPHAHLRPARGLPRPRHLRAVRERRRMRGPHPTLRSRVEPVRAVPRPRRLRRRPAACEATGACGQCSASNVSQCTGLAPLCDAPSGTCVACETDVDCAGAKPFCDLAQHACAACASTLDCVGSPAGPACVTAMGTPKLGSCVDCIADATCSGSTPRCDVTSNVCVACLTAADCSGATPACDGASQTCVPCIDDTTCAGATPVCSAKETCEPCQGGYTAQSPPVGSCPTSALPACQTGGTLAGQCTQCSAPDPTRCTGSGTTPVCVATSGACGCVLDTDCLAGTYCDTTRVTTGLCAPGCRVVGGKDGCPAGQKCDKQDGSLGVCIALADCTGNADCAAPEGVCNLNGLRLRHGHRLRLSRLRPGLPDRPDVHPRLPWDGRQRLSGGPDVLVDRRRPRDVRARRGARCGPRHGLRRRRLPVHRFICR